MINKTWLYVNVKQKSSYAVCASEYRWTNPAVFNFCVLQMLQLLILFCCRCINQLMPLRKQALAYEQYDEFDTTV